jgi:RNase H-like domain found in reverse transcriptase
VWRQLSHFPTPLLEVTKVQRGNTTFKRKKTQDKTFSEDKKIVLQNFLLIFPHDFNNTFGVHTDASNYQPGLVTSQDGHPIAFYIRKINEMQHYYILR